MRNFCDNIRRHQIRESELDDENLSQMKKGERKEIYIAVEQLLKFGVILNTHRSLIEEESINKFYSQMFEVLDATNKFICEGGISPDSDGKKLSHRIYDVFRNRELYIFWEEKFSKVGLDIRSLNIEEVISKPRIKRTKSKKKRTKSRVRTKAKKDRTQPKRQTRRHMRVKSVGRKRNEVTTNQANQRCRKPFCERVMSVFGRGKTKRKEKKGKRKNGKRKKVTRKNNNITKL